MKRVVVYTDGGCQGNPGPGGWAALLTYENKTRELTGGAPATTNNRMEMQAAIEALRALKEPCEVLFYTDSQYLRKGMTVWMKNWKKWGWKNAAAQPVKNVDLWQALDVLHSIHTISWQWVKGHDGQEGNERCDVLASREIEKIKRSLSPEVLRQHLEAFGTLSE